MPGRDGSEGLVGQIGPQGVQGSQGPQGPPGLEGQPGTSLSGCVTRLWDAMVLCEHGDLTRSLDAMVLCEQDALTRLCLLQDMTACVIYIICSRASRNIASFSNSDRL